jgi:hypothetical protein
MPPGREGHPRKRAMLAGRPGRRARVERVLTNLEPITQDRDPVIQCPRAVWLDITLSIVELESAIGVMKQVWWGPYWTTAARISAHSHGHNRGAVSLLHLLAAIGTRVSSI